MKPEIKENINLVSTVIAAAAGLLSLITIPLLCWGYANSKAEQTATITAHSDANVAALKQTMTESYETQSAHAADIASVKQWNQNLSDSVKTLTQTVNQNNTEQRLAIQHLGDKIDNSKP